ncbi:MAG: NUDIX hydrolase, partial [Dysgonomonas sp.]
CVIFGFHDGKLKVLLNKYRDNDFWMLPGGFVLKDEDVDDAAIRILKSRTGLDRIYLRQCHLFGAKSRINYDLVKQVLIKNDIPLETDGKKHWLLERFVSMSYYSLVESAKVIIQPTEHELSDWVMLDELPALYADHKTIIETAISSIRSQMGSLPIGYELLPERFTMSSLRLIYEAIIGEKLDRRNFQRKILSTGLVSKLEEKSKKKGVKSASLFSFNTNNYKIAEKKGMSFWR